MSKLDNVLAKAQKSMNLDIRSAREQCIEATLMLDSPGLNYVLGKGLRLTRAYLISGPFSQGKTSICNYIASQIQKKRTDGKNKVVYFDMEYALDLDHAAEMGLDLDPEKFILLRPKSAEDIFNLIPELADSGEVGLMVIDSLTSIESKAQIEGDIGAGFSGSKLASILAESMKKIIPYLYNNQCPLIMIAQERANLGSMYGPDFKVATSNAPLFYSSWNSRVTRTGDIVDPSTKEIIGLEIRVRNTKSKLDNPKRDANLKLMFKGGINSEEEYLDYLVQLGIVNKTGAMYEVKDDAWGMGKVRGIETVKSFLKDHPDIYEKVKQQVNEAISGHSVLDDMQEEDGLIFDPNTGEILNPEVLEQN